MNQIILFTYISERKLTEFIIICNEYLKVYLTEKKIRAKKKLNIKEKFFKKQYYCVTNLEHIEANAYQTK